MFSKNYLLITPCKNEGKNLPHVIDSVANQTILPVVWIIIDDGSTDDTSKVLQEYGSCYKWIRVLRLEEQPHDLGLHLAEVMIKGFDLAISYCQKNHLDYSYLGNLDGDIVLPNNFYENLINEFEKDASLGVASGGTENLVDEKLIKVHLRPTEPSGGHMLIRRKCFEECGGILRSYSVDSVVKAKARIRGWKTWRFEENITIELRGVNRGNGYWNGTKKMGESFYFRNVHPVNVGVKSIRYLIGSPHYGFIPFLVGYGKSVAK